MLKKKRFISQFIMAFLLVQNSFAQTNELDSLKKVFENAQTDTAKLSALVRLQVLLSHQDEKIKYLNKQLVLAKKLNKFEMIADVLGNLGWYQYVNQEFKTADSFYRESLAICDTYHFTRVEGSDYTRLMMLYWWQGKTTEGIAYFEKAETALLKANATKQLSSLYLNVAEIYKDLKFYDKSLGYAQKSFEFANKGLDTERIIQSAAFLGDAYLNAGKDEKAFGILSDALAMAQNRNDEYNQGDINYFLSIYYFNKKNYSTAAAHCNNAIIFFSKLHVNDRVLAALESLSDIYFFKQDFNKAREILLRQKQLMDSESNMDERAFYKNLANLDLVNKDIDAWARDNAKADSLETIYTSSELKKTVLEIDSKYQTSLKEREIIELKQQKDTQRLLIIGLWVSLIILAVTTFFIYRYINQKKLIAEQKNIQLQQEKQLIAVNSILKGQETERSRMAKDLHDGLGGMLSGIKLNLSSMKGNMIIHENDAQLFSKSITQLDNAIAEMRRVAHNMMPEALLKFGLAEAVQDYCDGINESNMVKMKFTQLGLQQPLDKSVEVVLYRIIQELSNNAIKHAAAENIFIQIDAHEKGITLTVEDDGNGYDVKAVMKGTGLQNVQSRVDYLKGSIHIKSENGIGTSVNIDIPL